MLWAHGVAESCHVVAEQWLDSQVLIESKWEEGNLLEMDVGGIESVLENEVVACEHVDSDVEGVVEGGHHLLGSGKGVRD